jgi:hypothetical protein
MPANAVVRSSSLKDMQPVCGQQKSENSSLAAEIYCDKRRFQCEFRINQDGIIIPGICPIYLLTQTSEPVSISLQPDRSVEFL